MIGFTPHGRITKKIYWEAQLFAMVRQFKDGITFFNFKFNWDRYESDHTPAIQIELTIFNLYFHLWISWPPEIRLDSVEPMDEQEYKEMCETLSLFGITPDELDEMATQYLSYNTKNSKECYEKAAKHLLKDKNIMKDII